MVHLTEDQIVQADGEAKRRGISRSALVRDALDAYLQSGRTATLDRQMQAGYDRIPQAGPDEWGSLEDLADRSTRESLSRLAAEEKSAGTGSW
jgi:hypothetical protein